MIDFQNISNITIPEGEVSVIAKGSEVLWRKQKYKREVAYLESTGTQYIDTGVMVTDTTGYYIELLPTDTKDQIYFGVRSYNQLGSNGELYKLYFGWKGVNTNSKYRPALFADKKNEITLNYFNDRKAFFNGVTDVNYVLNFETISSPSSQTLTLLARKENSGVVTYNAGCKLYAFKVSEGETIVRDFIPVLDWNDVPCMYDKVSGKLFYNKGTGEFICGDLIN